MKRISVLLMTLVLSVSLFAFPASANEVYLSSEIYHDPLFNEYMMEFGHVPVGEYYLDFLPSDDLSYNFNRMRFSEIIVTVEPGESARWPVGNIILSNVDDDNDVIWIESVTMSVHCYDDSLVLSTYTDLGSADDHFPGHEAMIARLVPVNDDSSGAASGSSLSGIVNGDMLSGVLDNIVSLLPAVLVLIVAYIAIRKGIGFVRDLLHAA